MTTMREEFEAWIAGDVTLSAERDSHGYTDFLVGLMWNTWKAAHLAGQQAMQERAAIHCEKFSLAVSDSDWSKGYATALKDAACGIRALEVKP